MECNKDAYEEEEYLEEPGDMDSDHQDNEWFPQQQTPSPQPLCSQDPLPIPDDLSEVNHFLPVDGSDDDDHSCFNCSIVSDGAAENYLYFFKATMFRRLYRGQMRPREVGTKNVFGDSVEDVIKCIWKLSVAHVSRQINFDDDGPKWAEKQVPDQEDIEKFVTMQDQMKRKAYTISGVTPRLLASWRGKQIKMFIHAYSVNVETNPQHQMVLKQLIAPNNPDRSGAHSTRDDAALAKELKNNHPELEGHHSSWLLWANTIHSSAAHKQEEMKNAPSPPLELAKYFRWTGVSEAARLQSVHRGASVAHAVNGGWMKDVEEVFQGISSAVSILSNVARKLEGMIAKGKAAEEIIIAVQSAVRPEETEVSKVLADSVTDCPDVDHM